MNDGPSRPVEIASRVSTGAPAEPIAQNPIAAPASER